MTTSTARWTRCATHPLLIGLKWTPCPPHIGPQWTVPLLIRPARWTRCAIRFRLYLRVQPASTPLTFRIRVFSQKHLVTVSMMRGTERGVTHAGIRVHQHHEAGGRRRTLIRAQGEGLLQQVSWQGEGLLQQ
eukprot:5398438-Pyramimonas_sp.AAC.2